MARLQILELPEGAGDERPPFVLIVDEYVPERYITAGGTEFKIRDRFEGLAEKIGARAVLAFEETIEIPANEVTIGPDGYPVRLRVEADLDGFHEQVAEAQADAQRKLSQSETLGHKLLQRAEIAEDITEQTKRLMQRRTDTLRTRAEAAEEKLTAFAEQTRLREAERMDRITDALGLDRLRNWDEIIAAAAQLRPQGAGETSRGEG
ncbi:hypothetical protein ABZ330_21745 [Streptomyces sp. NPDC006172]|uniref:hypothetical protein n=1 Tax=Streptomyces sp. NPDC006172 TaxID=3154470 RepID=UPI0033C03BFE